MAIIHLQWTRTSVVREYETNQELAKSCGHWPATESLVRWVPIQSAVNKRVVLPLVFAQRIIRAHGRAQPW